MSQKTPWELAKEKREQQEKEKQDKKNKVGFDYENFQLLALEDKKEKVFRVIGNPIEVRVKSTDPKLVMLSSILRDDGKGYIKVRWPYIEKDGTYVTDPDWILTKLYATVNDRVWQKYEDGHTNERGFNGEWFYKYKNTKSYARIEGNTKPNDKYQKRFYPSKVVVMNVIDRHDTWCAENKHSKLLISKLGIKEVTDDKGQKKQIYYPSVGIPKGAYDKIFKHFESTGGDWFSTDCILIKISDDKGYSAYDKADSRYISKEASALANDLPLTEEENSYEVYDLDKFYGITSYSKLKKHLIGLFKLVDAELGSSFAEELTRLADEEEKQRKINNQTEEKDEEDLENISSSIEDNPFNEGEKKEEPKKETKSARRSNTSSKSIREVCAKNFPKWDKLSATDKDNFEKAIDHFDGVVPVYKSGTNDLLCSNTDCKFPDTNTETSFPDNVSICPVCGAS